MIRPKPIDNQVSSKAERRAVIELCARDERWDDVRPYHLLVRFCSAIFGACLLAAPGLLSAATNAGSDDIPPLRPPHAELPPTFWEQRGGWVVVAALAGVVLVALAIWLLRRVRPSVPLDPQIQARTALEPMRTQPEDGFLLSRVSQVLHRYFTGAFKLPPEELTTHEFCDLIAGSESVGPQLATSLGGFLRLCDERKFAPNPQPDRLDAVQQALKFIEQAEARRAELRQAEQKAALGK